VRPEVVPDSRDEIERCSGVGVARSLTMTFDVARPLPRYCRIPVVLKQAVAVKVVAISHGLPFDP
jgi:hypothetical protein